MAQVQLGDRVLVYSHATKKAEWSMVTSYLHFEPDGVTSFLELDFGSSSKLRLTPDHRMFTERGDVYAADARVGDKVFVACEEGPMVESTIQSIQEVSGTGLFCPLTRVGTIIVDGAACSCHANCSHLIGNAIFAPLRFMSPGGPSQPSTGVHWYPKFLIYLFLTLASALPDWLLARMVPDDSPLWHHYRAYAKNKLNGYSKLSLQQGSLYIFVICLMLLGVACVSFRLLAGGGNESSGSFAVVLV